MTRKTKQARNNSESFLQGEESDHAVVIMMVVMAVMIVIMDIEMVRDFEGRAHMFGERKKQQQQKTKER